MRASVNFPMNFVAQTLSLEIVVFVTAVSYQTDLWASVFGCAGSRRRAVDLFDVTRRTVADRITVTRTRCLHSSAFMHALVTNTYNCTVECLYCFAAQFRFDTLVMF